MSGSLVDGRTIRTFNVLDDYNREILGIEIDTSLPSLRVIRVLDAIAEERSYPTQIRLDNGPEFISQKLAAWVVEHQVTLAFIEPGKPSHNAYVDSFNRTYREAVLDANWFSSIQEAQDITEEWMLDYNSMRPHEALGGIPPLEFAQFSS